MCKEFLSPFLHSNTKMRTRFQTHLNDTPFLLLVLIISLQIAATLELSVFQVSISINYRYTESMRLFTFSPFCPLSSKYVDLRVLLVVFLLYINCSSKTEVLELVQQSRMLVIRSTPKRNY